MHACRFLTFCLCAILASACDAQPDTKPVPGEPVPREPLSWSEVQERALPPAGERVAYGTAPQQFGELRVPAGAGPFPVLVLIHGGCWLNAFDYRYFTHLADALTRETGAATWNLEFRRLGDPGGGWPGSLLDVAQATDHLRELGASHRLDVKRVVSIGHSAGGQLALWLAARAKLPLNSDLYRPDPLPLRGAIGLAPITDLAAYGAEPGGCNSAVGGLIGGIPRSHKERYQLASPRELLPLGVPQWLIQGLEDPIVPARSVRLYAEAARAAGDSITLEQTAGAGHFEPAVPGSASWPALLSAVRAALVM